MLRMPSAILALVMASSPLISARNVHAQARDSVALYGTWRWIESVGGFTPGRSTPAACGCERLLVLKPKGAYEFVERDSAHEYLLCAGRFSIHRGAGSFPIIADADFWLSFDHWWLDYERDQLVQFLGRSTDTVLTYPAGADDGVSNFWPQDPKTPGPTPLRHRFARVTESSTPNSVRGGKSRLTLRDRPSRSAIEEPPGENEFFFYKSPPIPISQPEPLYPEVEHVDHPTNIDVILHVLVGRDGRVKDVRVFRGTVGLNEAAVVAVKKWVFKPALGHHNEPVQAWIEVPIHFHF